MLFRYRKRLLEPGVRLQLGFLFSNYNHDSWWWELVEMAHSARFASRRLRLFLSFVRDRADHGCRHRVLPDCVPVRTSMSVCALNSAELQTAGCDGRNRALSDFDHAAPTM